MKRKAAAAPPHDTLVGLRLPAALLAALDREVARRAAAHPGANVSRASVVREALYKTVRGARR